MNCVEESEYGGFVEFYYNDGNENDSPNDGNENGSPCVDKDDYHSIMSDNEDIDLLQENCVAEKNYCSLNLCPGKLVPPHYP